MTLNNVAVGFVTEYRVHNKIDVCCELMLLEQDEHR